MCLAGSHLWACLPSRLCACSKVEGELYLWRGQTVCLQVSLSLARARSLCMFSLSVSVSFSLSGSLSLSLSLSLCLSLSLSLFSPFLCSRSRTRSRSPLSFEISLGTQRLHLALPLGAENGGGPCFQLPLGRHLQVTISTSETCTIRHPLAIRTHAEPATAWHRCTRCTTVLTRSHTL
jgi:hypothetical protein